MTKLLALLILLWLPFAAVAQDDDDEGYLTRLIEDNLSGVSREVNIVGFAGALRSEATIQQMTVSDAEGVWLTLEDLVLTWNRTAILRGAIDVEQIRAGRIVVSRAPISEDSGPSPEAKPFSLPDLPVSVVLETLDVERIELAEEFLGEPVVISLNGSAELSGGQGTANVVAERLEGKRGLFEINGSYANETNVLGMLLNLEEGADGIAARILDLPGRPAIGLTIDGTAPLSDYAASLAISTDGVDRLTGAFGLTQDPDGRLVSLDVGGDVTPLFEPAYQGFFGNDAQLRVRARQTTDGRIDVSDLDLRSQRLNLAGALLIGAQGWPQLISLTGGITATPGEPVLLPLSGDPTYVDGMRIDITYDGAQSDDWRADIIIDGFDRPGLGIDQLSLQGGGILRNGEGDETGQFIATLDYGATGLVLDDSGAAQALGNAVTGTFAAERIEGEPTRITQFSLSGAGVDANTVATISGPSAGFQTRATSQLSVAGLERFSTLIGQPLGGAANFSLLANVTPLDGLFSILLTGTTNNLSVGIEQADAVLAGTGTLSANAVRDAQGTRLEALRIETDAALITADAELTSDGSTAQFDATLNELALVVPKLSGPATAIGIATITGDGQAQFDLRATGPAANVMLSGTADPAETGRTINATLNGTVLDLTRYAQLAGQAISGSVSFGVDGVLLSDGLRFDANIQAQTNNLQTGIARIDPLIDGRGTVSASVARIAERGGRITDLQLQTPALTLNGNATLDLDGDNSADLDLTVFDAGLIDPSLSGPATAQLTLEANDAETLNISLAATGPDAAIDLAGTLRKDSYQFAGDISAQASDLATFQQIIGQPLSGAVSVTASGSVLPDLSTFDSQIKIETNDLAIGNATADVLLRGTGRVNSTISQADGVLSVNTLEVSTPQFSIVGALNGAAGIGQGRFNASLRDVGVLTDQVSGPIRATGSASLNDSGSWGVDASGTGPGGLRANVSGLVNPGADLNLSIDGSAPLALANTAIDPRRLSGLANFDLTMNGPPALGSLGGQITFSDGRFTAPTLAAALSDIGGQITIAGGSAQIGITALNEGGGSIRINGPVGLVAPNVADVTIRLDDVQRSEPSLYSTSADGVITITGALQGGARIDGQIEMGETNIQVPSSSISTLGELPDVIHVGQSAAVQQTLDRAGVNASGSTGNSSSSSGSGASGGSSTAYPLDLEITAPGRIFIRGRGLDAELGGSLTIGGTTKNVIPNGRFELVRGRLDILQQRFDLTEGSATMQGGFDPYIRLVAQTEASTGTTISIIVEGTPDDPEITFESSPTLPQDEVLSQLIFGRDLDSITPLQAIQLASAISTLAGRGGGAFERLRENIGVDDLDISTDEEGETSVTAGKYLSDNVYTDVTVTSEGGTEINLNLDITDQLTAKGSVDQDGETGVGLFFERDY